MSATRIRSRSRSRSRSSASEDTKTLPTQQGTKRKRTISNRARPKWVSSDGDTDQSAVAQNSHLRKRFRLAGLYNDGYRRLLNRMIGNANKAPCNLSRVSGVPVDVLGGSQIGMSFWREEEKEALFSAVERYGRDDLKRLAQVTGKAEQEVHVYLHLLRQGLLQLEQTQPGNIRSQARLMPVAAEISEECCEALELCADSLAWYQKSWEVKEAQKEHGGLWLLDRQVAEDIDNLFSQPTSEAEGVGDDSENEAGDESRPSPSDAGLELGEESEHYFEGNEILHAVPGAQLLDLSKLIELSECVFMNSDDAESDWRSYEDPLPVYRNGEQWANSERGPSIFHTAFHDLHHLTISLTRKLVRIAMFQATSRLRAMDNIEPNRWYAPIVRRRDVLSALRIVGCPKDSFKFWATLPRRHKSTWFYQENVTRHTKKITVSDKEAEAWLSRRDAKVRPPEVGEQGFKVEAVDERSGVQDGSGRGAASAEEESMEGMESEEQSREEEMSHEGKEGYCSDSSETGQSVHMDETDHGKDNLSLSQSGSDVHSTDIDSDSDSDSDNNVDTDINLSDATGEDTTEAIANEEQSNDDYYEIIDSIRSREKELELWALLQQDLPGTVHLSPLDAPAEPPRMALLHEYGNSQEEWRDWTERRAEWETSGESGDSGVSANDVEECSSGHADDSS